MLIDEALGTSKRRLAALEEAAEAIALAPDETAAAAAEAAYTEIFSDVMAHDDWNAEHHAEVVLDHLGLTGTAPDGAPITDQLTTEISGGQRARLGLALTLIRKPEILLLDEPTNHLDERGRNLVIDTIVQHTGVVVVATHDRDFLDAVCTLIGDLVPGRRASGFSGAITPTTTSIGDINGLCGSTSGAPKNMSAIAWSTLSKMMRARYPPDAQSRTTTRWPTTAKVGAWSDRSPAGFAALASVSPSSLKTAYPNLQHCWASTLP